MASPFTTQPPETYSGVVTSWLPLTIPFPYQTRCSSIIPTGLPDDPVSGWPPGYVLPPPIFASAFFNIDPISGALIHSLTCVPPEAQSSRFSQVGADIGELQTRYSLGPLVCPEAYTVALTIPINLYSTQLACCPS